MSYTSIASTVSLLLKRRGPSTIFRFVVAVMIYSIYGMFQARRIAHIGGKVLEAPPTFADRDSSSAPMGKIAACRVKTPISHPAPRSIQLRGLARPSMAMRKLMRIMQQAAARSQATCKYLAGAKYYFATSAFAFPERRLTSAIQNSDTRKLYYQQFIKAMSKDIKNAPVTWPLKPGSGV